MGQPKSIHLPGIDPEPATKIAAREFQSGPGAKPDAKSLERAAEQQLRTVDTAKEQPADTPSQDAFRLETPRNAIGKAWDDNLQASWSDAARGVGLSQEEAQEVLDSYAAVGYDAKSYDVSSGWDAFAREFADESAASEAQGVISRFVAERPTLATFLESSGLGNDPRVLLLIHEYAVTRGSSAKDAQAEIDKIMADPKHGYWSGDKRAVRRMARLHQLADVGSRAPFRKEP
jgi:hypothetical protein